jgi:predicted methyltransferase
MLAAHPEAYGKVQVTVLAPGKMHMAPDGTADMVVTFRNIHNWVWACRGRPMSVSSTPST